MHNLLVGKEPLHFARRGVSRRDFGRIAAWMTTGAALPLYNEPALAQLSAVRGPIPQDAVKIDANENPLGPCEEAAAAIHEIVSRGGRYLYEQTAQFVQLMAEQEGLRPDSVRAFAGSSAPLHQAVLAFTGPNRPLVTADPGYEAAGLAAAFLGAKTLSVPLTKDYRHDVKAMAAASPEAGLIYICNPNNPTGTITPKSEIEWLAENKPKGAVVLVDEAYIHFSEEPTCADLVAKEKDLILLRTFSKIYGMAGIRAGVAMGRPDLLAKISGYSAGAMPITAMAAAIASLRARDLVPKRRKITADTRNETFAFLERHHFRYVPSVSNKFMVDVGRPGRLVIEAMRKEKVYIGRVWPSWPTYVRVSIGTPEEMKKFQSAFLKVMAS
jgi:histidinol-phosphate aminotransferase